MRKESQAMKSIHTVLYVAMALVVVLLIGAAVILFRSEPLPVLSSLFPQTAKLHIYIQSPPMVEIGKEFSMILTVQNEGDEFIQVDEIRFPESLLELAVIKSIVPGTLEQNFYGDHVGFKIGFLIEPRSRKEFEITLQPWQAGDVASNMQVIAGKTIVEADFRLVMVPAVVEAPSATPSFTPTSTATLIPNPPSPTVTPIIIPYASVVRLTAKIKYSSYFRDAWSGSGAIVSPDGLILTNAHLVKPPIPGVEADAFAIGITLDPGAPPVDRYYAEPLVVDKDLDLAVLRITKDLRFKEVDGETLNLPSVTLGDSDALQLGDALTILGYPGIGGDTITLTRGEVGGFTSEKKYGGRAWIKTAASISGGTSGGIVMDKNGLMVAVPTQLGYGGDQDLVDCRVITDTNMDGRINAKDMCIPTGGFINALRPIKFAIALIEQARITPLLEESPTPTP
jgi:S1-C subfamily serine protease